MMKRRDLYLKHKEELFPSQVISILYHLLNLLYRTEWPEDVISSLSTDLRSEEQKVINDRSFRANTSHLLSLLKGRLNFFSKSTFLFPTSISEIILETTSNSMAVITFTVTVAITFIR